MVNGLSNLPITARILTETRIGRGVNSIVKDGIFKLEPINELALTLVNDWKAIVHNQNMDKSLSNNTDQRNKNTSKIDG